MITVINKSLDPFYNQAFEEYIFQTFRGEDVFFLWRNKPSVIVGCYQNIFREVSVETLRRLGIPVVRRMSGGGTVYHDLGNINYTYITDEADGVDYDACLTPVISALNRMGIPAKKRRSCDIAIGEQKISGSAQHMAGGRILHHGTLLFETDLSVLDQITTEHKNEAFQSKGTASAICPVTNIREQLDSPLSIDEFQTRFLTEVLGADFVTQALNADQLREIRKLRDEKYLSWEWTWGKTPAFTYEKEGLFLGSPIRIRYQAKRGIISGAEITCALLNQEKAAFLFNGVRLSPENFHKLCSELAGADGGELIKLFM